MSETGTLVKTILTDLDQGYVDDAGAKKLFKTGVNAMMNLLDPYTFSSFLSCLVTVHPSPPPSSNTSNLYLFFVNGAYAPPIFNQ